MTYKCCDMVFYTYDALLRHEGEAMHSVSPEPVSVLREADEIVTSDRQRDYGHPLDNFTDIADLWTVILRKTRGGGSNFYPIQAEEVALMMDVLKVSREINTPKHDNRVDGPGYWKCLDMIITERERRLQVMDDE